MPVPTTNLLIDLDARTGVTASGGRLVSWTPAQGSISADATQGTAGLRPYVTTDANGDAVIRFTWGSSGTHPKLRVDLPTMTTTPDEVSVYVVCTTNSGVANQTIVQLGTNWIVGFLRLFTVSDSPLRMATPTQGTSVYCPINKGVRWINSGTVDCRLGFNADAETVTKTPGGFSLTGGGIIGYNADNDEPFSGDIYRVLIYDESHDPTERAAVLTALYADHELVTAYDKVIVFEGDSLTEGAASTDLKNYPNQAITPDSDWLGYNVATGGNKIGALATAGTMANTEAAQIDPLFDAGMSRNVLCILAGTNDISSDGLTGAQCFTRLTDMLDATQLAGFENWVITLPDRGDNDTAVADYNTLIRGGDSSIDVTIDVGKGSPTETRLSDSTNATYYQADELHLTNAGYGVIADGVGEHLLPLAAPTPTLVSKTATTITVSWTSATGGTAPYSYDANLREVSGGAIVDTQSAVTSPQTFTGLDPNTAYYITVFVSDSAGDPAEDESDELTVTTNSTGGVVAQRRIVRITRPGLTRAIGR